MRELKRAMHFDFHSMPDYPDLFDDFCGKDFAKILSDANVAYINFFARCNVGFSYYPTEVGIPHPFLKNRDISGRGNQRVPQKEHWCYCVLEWRDLSRNDQST